MKNYRKSIVRFRCKLLISVNKSDTQDTFTKYLWTKKYAYYKNSRIKEQKRENIALQMLHDFSFVKLSFLYKS